MVAWIALNFTTILNIFGLACDLIGAVLVATEVVNQFRGQQFSRGPAYPPDVGPVSLPAPHETDEYDAWNARKFSNMKIGLVFLVGGFVVQIIANVIQLKSV